MTDRRTPEPMFVGWNPDVPRVDRRFLLGAAVGLIAAAGGVGFVAARSAGAPGGGGWDQSAVGDYTGELVREPYPMLRMIGPDGRTQTALLGRSGKLGIARGRLPAAMHGLVTVRASLIQRGEHRMLAAAEADDWIRLSPEIDAPPPPVVTDLGPVSATGEILDAKCWFGAMRPGFGKTHKACASLCARGGLPLAFCMDAACAGDGDAPLFLTGDGGAHGAAILPFVADPLLVHGRLVRVDDLLTLRVDPTAMVRL